MGRETVSAGDATVNELHSTSKTYEQKSNIKLSLENKNLLNNNTIDKYVSGNRAYIGQNTTSVPTSLTNASIGTQDSTIRPTFIPRIKSSEVSNSGKKYTFIQSAKGSGAEAISAKRQVNSLKMRSTTSLASKKSSVVHLLEKSTPAYNSRKYSITQFIPLDSEKSPNETIHITEILNRTITKITNFDISLEGKDGFTEKVSSKHNRGRNRGDTHPRGVENAQISNPTPDTNLPRETKKGIGYISVPNTIIKDTEKMTKKVMEQAPLFLQLGERVSWILQ